MSDMERTEARSQQTRVAPFPADELDFAALANVARRQASVFARTSNENESIAQEALARAWERRGTYDPRRGHPESWLFGLIRNVARERYRDRHRRASLLERLSRARINNEWDANERDTRMAIIEAVMTLSPDRQELLFLRFWERWEHKAIARRLGISDAACRQRLRRAILQIGWYLR